MSFASRYSRGSMKSFIGDVKKDLGVVVSEEEVNALVEAGKIEKDNYNCIPYEDLDMVLRWVKNHRPDPSTWDEPPLFSISSKGGSATPSDFGGSSGDASDRLFKFAMERMKKDGISYSMAINLVQKEYPELAKQVAQGLDDYRHRNDKPRF